MPEFESMQGYAEFSSKKVHTVLQSIMKLCGKPLGSQLDLTSGKLDFYFLVLIPLFYLPQVKKVRSKKSTE